MKKNIVWIHSHFLFWMGGTKYVYEVVKRLAKKHRVIVIVEAANPLAYQQYHQIGVELISLDALTSTSFLYWVALPWFIERRVTQINRIIKAHHFLAPDTTIISSMFPMNVIANKLGFRHLQLCYEPFAFFYDREFIATFSWLKKMFIKLVAGLYQHLDKQAVAVAHQVLTLNQVTQSAIKDIYQVDSELIFAGVDTKRFKPYVPPALNKLYRKRPVVIHSTDYSPVKGTDRVIKAMAKVVAKVPSALLLVTSTIRNQKAEDALKSLATSLGISRNLRFMGFISLEELPHYYSLAQVLVQGSNSARSGTTSMALPVKEAMCCETPAIRPDVGGDDVVDGVSGFLVDPADTDQLAEKIAYLLIYPAQARKMGRAARKAIANKYTWEKTVKRLSRFL